MQKAFLEPSAFVAFIDEELLRVMRCNDHSITVILSEFNASLARKLCCIHL